LSFTQRWEEYYFENIIFILKITSYTTILCIFKVLFGIFNCNKYFKNNTLSSIILDYFDSVLDFVWKNNDNYDVVC